MTALRILPVLVFAAACSGADLAPTQDLEAGNVAPGTLRVDVYPPSGVGSPDLVTQSHEVAPGDYRDHTIDLVPTVVFAGTLTGDVASAWSGAVEVPSTIEPIMASFEATLEGTRQMDAVPSGEDGHFSLSLPAYDRPYDLRIVPNDASAVPFHREERLFDHSATEDLHLDAGIPVYGRVADSEGNGVAGVSMRITLVDRAISSSTFVTDRSGWYTVHVEEAGEYVIETVGGVTGDGFGAIVPDLATDVLVEPGATGVEADVDLGILEVADVEGDIRDVDGARVGSDAVTVRLSSTALDGSTGTLVRDVAPDTEGHFSISVLPGTYDVAVIPAYDMDASPVSNSFAVDPGENDLGVMTLGAPSRLSGQVVDSNGRAAGNVLVTAKQLTYDHYVYDTTTNADGDWSLSVPETEYTVTFTPISVGIEGALTEIVLRPGDGILAPLLEGSIFDGTVLFDGEEVPFAMVEVYDASTGALVGRGTTNEAGGYSLRVHVEAPEDADDTGAR